MTDRWHYDEMHRRTCAGCGCDFETTVKRRRLCRQCAWAKAEQWGRNNGDDELATAYDWMEKDAP